MKLALADIRSDDEIEDFAEALLDSLGLPKEFEWNEEDHPRHEAGSPEGGRFAPKGEGGQHPQKGKPRAQAGSLGEQLSPAEKAERAKLVAQVENAAKEWVAEKRAGGGTFGRKELAELSRHLGETQGEAIDAMINKFSDPKNYHERPMVHLCIGDEQNPDIWLLGWRESSKEIEGTPIHDHGDSEAGIYVHRGSVTEHIYAIDKSQVGKGIGSEVDFRQVERGFDHKSTATINAPYIHDIYDAEGGSNLSVTIHSYYPPLRHMRFYEVKGDKLVQTGEWDDRAKKHALLHYDRTDWTRSPFGHCQRYHGDHDQEDHGNWADGQGGPKSDSSQTKGRLTEKSREAFVGEYPEGGYESEAVQAYYAREKEWQRNVREDLSFGRLTPKEARALGYTYTGERDSQEQWKPLPEELWHVTTATDAVNATGLKTRDELKMQSGSGLGGGQSDTISFTADPKVAEGIYRGVLEAREVAAGNVSAQQLLDAAFAGNQAQKEWGTAIVRGFDKDWKQGDPYPYAIDTLLRGVHYKYEIALNPKDIPPGGTPVFPTHKDANGVQRYAGYEIPMTPEERAESTFDFYKRWATFREFEGKGPLDPLFFLTDVKALAATPPEQISIGKFRPIPGAQGFTVSALGEWRVYTGKVVEPVANERPAVKLFHLAGTDDDHDQSTHGRGGGGDDGYKTIDTTKLPDDTMLGHAGRIIDGELVGFHVTSDPEPLEKALKEGGDLTNTRVKGDTGDLGGGLYFSYAPQLWMARASGKWSFLKSLEGNQNMLLAEHLLDEVSKQRKEKYISQTEFEYAERIINQFAQTGQEAIVGLAGQPYNISFWKSDYLNKLGIKPGKQPIEIDVRARGKFAEVDASYLTPDQVTMLRGKGFDGAFVRGGMATLPQTVIWNKNAITQFGGYRNKKEFHLAYHLEGAHDQGEHGNWADGESSDRGVSKAALQKHLVDYKAERELTGPGTVPIKEILPKSKSVGYLDVPGIDKMHRLMQVEPSLETDPKQYVDARDRLFKGEPVMPVPIGVLTFTQPKINTDRAQELTKTPEQLEIPVQVVRSGSKFFLMNGHHRVIASHLAGRGEIAANVLDLNRPHEFEWFPFHLQGQHDQQTHNPHLDSAKKVEMETKFLKDRATKSEPATTKLIKEVVDRNEGKLEGLDFRVKSEESLARKIAARARANPGLEPGDVAANSISDALRYTAVLKDDQYATAVKDMLSHLESKGFKVDKIKNYWQPGDDYNGINVTLRDPEELKVELQFHTPDSFHVKEKESHPLYEKMRTAKDPTVAKQLKQQMIDIWSKVQVPAGVMTLGILATT